MKKKTSLKKGQRVVVHGLGFTFVGKVKSIRNQFVNVDYENGLHGIHNQSKVTAINGSKKRNFNRKEISWIT